jgi:ribonuclease BN (tRNA processing enzyme)
MTPSARALVEGVDVLLHDAQFLETERSLADDYGHATVEETIALAEEAGVGRLVLFHHSPVRTDDQLDRIGELAESAGVPVLVAGEGMRVPVATRDHDAAATTRQATGSVPSGP